MEEHTTPHLYNPAGRGLHAFHMAWLDSCLEETLLPGRPWHKVYEKLSTALAKEVEAQLKSSPQGQLCLDHLGGHFVENYLSSLSDQTSFPCPPTRSKSEKASLEREVLSQLDTMCERAAESSLCQRRPDGDYAGVCQEMRDFIDDTYNIVQKEMEQMLSVEERKEKERLEFDPVHMDSAWALTARRRPQSVESKDLHLTTRRAPAFQLKPHEVGVLCLKLQPPPLHSAQSEAVGHVVATLLTSDPGRMQDVCERLRGGLLPASLRSCVWIDKLLQTQASSHRSALWSFERAARETFGRTVQRRVAELKLRSATRSPISGLIENAVVEKYERTPCMQVFATDEQMISESSKALNILYVHSGIYEPYLIHWLFPLQIAFPRAAAKGEHCYELSMFLHLLIQRFPGWPEIFASAENVLRCVEEQDPDLFAHLQLCSSQNVVLDSKDFLVELITQERDEARKLLDVPGRSDGPQAVTRQLLADPVIFLRKWMGEGFLSVLDLPAVLLIWDQLFLQDWSRTVMEDFSLAVLMLLKDPLLAADDFHSMRAVMLDHAGHLFTTDIRQAWIHLQQGGLAADIPGFNRLNTRLLYGPFPKKTATNVSIPAPLSDILPTGLKDVSVSLILRPPTTTTAHHSWLKDFDPLAVRLTASVFYGDVKLRSKSSLKKPSVEKRVPEKKMAAEYKLHFNDVFLFDSLDPSEFREIDPLRDKPAVVIKVVYSPNVNGFSPVTLGWVRADLLREEKAGLRTLWAPGEFTAHLPLRAGPVPEPLSDQGSANNLIEPLQRGSDIQVTVYDPFKDGRRQVASPAWVQSSLPEEPSEQNAPWVPHNPALAVVHQATARQPFDLYIDSVHNIPDNATIVKVTGRILRSGVEDLPDILALPDLTSPARSPEFHFRMTVEAKDHQPFDHNLLLLLRVYTISALTGELCVIGNCIVRAFSDQEQLNAGGHQLRLRGGMPSKDQTPLTDASLSHQPVIPCCTLLIRILPHRPDVSPSPDYRSGFYFTDRAKPNQSELGIISTFQRNTEFPRTVGEMVQQLVTKEQANVPPDRCLAWYEERLDARKQLPPQHPPAHLSVHHMVCYQQQAGVRVRIAQAFGLPDGLYVNAFARVLRGFESSHLPELPQGWGGEEKFVTRRHDFRSLQMSPRWTDQSTVLHPYLHPHTVLLVQLFGLSAVYIPDLRGQSCGTVSSRPGHELKLDTNSQLGWAVVPLFDGPFAWIGVHHSPLFQGNPNGGFLAAVVSGPPQGAIESGLRDKTLKPLKSFGSVTVEVWDGHYLDDERHDLPIVDSLLPMDNKKKFAKTQARKAGKALSQLVLQSLDAKTRKQGVGSAEYRREEHFYEEAMGDTFYALMETALMNAGYGPL
ncbi:uncharacterized protein LOC136718517 [Amia ocellicauda]|uniref:uncharacterized protein LOC136718517 n=1 Tax=Amia ocellicauda TaxID=2972642 RepID=UPI0034639C3F